MQTPTDEAIKSMRIQLARLFGEHSKIATDELRTSGQWRRVLRAVLKELEQYLRANVDNDELHKALMVGGLMGAQEALKREEFWPGYVEGVTRILLTLLGDYPDHHKRRPGRKDEAFYKLNRRRTVHWVQTPDQRLKTLFQVGEVGWPELSAPPLEVLFKFREIYGPNRSYADFMDWYRTNYPRDYASVFQ